MAARSNEERQALRWQGLKALRDARPADRLYDYFYARCILRLLFDQTTVEGQAEYIRFELEMEVEHPPPGRTANHT